MDKIRKLCGVIDSEWDVLKDMSTQDLVTYLMESFGVTWDEAMEALDSMGLLGGS